MRLLTGAVLLAGLLSTAACDAPESEVSDYPVAAPAPAPLQSSGYVYRGQQGIYTVEVPAGWFEIDAGGSADAAFAPPGGNAYGSIFVGVEYTRRTLEEETEYVAGGNTIEGRRRLSIGAMPCITFASTGSRGERDNNLACQIVVPFQDGARRLTFFIGSASRPWEYAAQTDLFWQMVNSIRWADDVTADAADEGDG